MWRRNNQEIWETHVLLWGKHFTVSYLHESLNEWMYGENSERF
jgi:hypothetical protein